MSPSPRTLRPLSTAVAALIGISLMAFGFGAASATAPVNVSGPITDQSGALEDRTAEVRAALDDLFDSTGQQLFVVYVDSFDGLSGQDWADQSAETSDLGDADILLAVATTDRAYGFSVTDANELSDRDLERVATNDLLPRLRDEDWAGAAIAAARGYDDALNPGVPWGVIGVGGVAVVGVGAVVGVRARRRRTANEPDEALDKRSGSALVALDDGIRSAEQELSYAEAQFGKEATTQFTTALAEARDVSTSAFELRHQLDDSHPESGPEHDQIAQQILDLCAKADAILDDQIEAFAHLRDLQAKVPEVLTAMAERARGISDRLPTSRAVLEGLAVTHPGTNLASVGNNVEQAAKLAATALEQTELGTASVSADDRATAVVHARSAEDAVAQATTLLDALDRADADLAAAAGLITAGITSLTADLADAAQLAPTDPAVGTAAAAARRAMDAAGQPGLDPLATVGDLQAAEATLDELLAAPRAAADKARKDRAALAGAFDGIRARVTAVNDYIQTRRGVIGPDARTRLAEATRQMQVATELQPTDPTAALTALSRASDLLVQAENLAQSDVSQWDRQQQPDTTGGILGGLLGGSGGRSSGWSGRSSSRSRSRSASRPRRQSSSRRSSSRRSSSRRGGGGRF